MTATAPTISVIESDIPAHLTLVEWRRAHNLAHARPSRIASIARLVRRGR